MHIAKVASFRGSWELINNHHKSEISEILEALKILAEYSENYDFKTGLPSPREQWENFLGEAGWTIFDRVQFIGGKRINLSRLGPTKAGVGATLPFGAFDHFSRWLFQQSALAIRHGLIKLPIMLIPVREYMKRQDARWLPRISFEMHVSQIELLSPLTFPHPFLVVGYTDQEPTKEIEITEIEIDPYSGDENSVVDRCIEFPPEYHQAGLGILNFFGTYLREQYPEEQASVKIEQHGLNVRMVISTEDGKSEIIEKALHEYELIITGTEPPEKFAKKDELILELRNELRIAQFRVEAKNDIISLQNAKLDQLLTIVGNGLSQRNQVSIDFQPIITLKNEMGVTINQDVSEALGCIGELLEGLPESNAAHFALKELEGSLAKIEENTDKDSVRRSSAMSKFKRIVDKIVENGSDLNVAIKKVDSGWTAFSELAKKYNKLAEWCGLPVVPSALLKQ